MRGKYVLIAVVLLSLGFGAGRFSTAKSSAASGTLDPEAPPDSTDSYTLEDIYNRLNAGTEGTQSTFAEPTTGPTAATGHTLNDIMTIAPAADSGGAEPANVLAGKAYWSLLTGGSGTWGTRIGTMPNNGTVIYSPGTNKQTVAEGYHNGLGYVEGDPDLVAGNIKDGVNIFGVAGTYTGGVSYPAPVPVTGQTFSYDTGDDGDLEIGVVWPSPRFTDNKDGTVTDELTGLIWLKDAGCIGQHQWADALDAIGELNVGTDFSCASYTAGTYSDWRLPNVRELQSLVDYGSFLPALPSGHPFTSVQSGYYWSSTTESNTSTLAFYMYMDNGIMYCGDKASKYDTWPVRGGGGGGV